jgi:hypothetical protein
MGETVDGLPLLERLLRNAHEDCHLQIADILWDADSDTSAVAALERLAATDGQLAAWEAEVKAGRGVASGGSSSEGRPGGGGGKKGGRGGGGGGERGGRGGGRGGGSGSWATSSADEVQG